MENGRRLEGNRIGIKNKVFKNDFKNKNEFMQITFQNFMEYLPLQIRTRQIIL